MNNMFRKLSRRISQSVPRNPIRWMSKKSGEKKEHSNLCCLKRKVLFECAGDMRDRGIYVADPFDVEKALPQPRVVIIGGGIAGLSAAVRLMQNGINDFVILEATGRVGGRILSEWLGDVVVELGAHWKPDNCCNHPVFQMRTTEDPPQPGVPAAMHTRSLFNRVSLGRDSNAAVFAAYQKFRQIEKETHNLYCHGGSKQHGSLIEFMSLRIQQELHDFPEDHQYDAARIMFGLAHMQHARSPDDVGWLAEDDEMGAFMCLPGGGVRVPLGLIGIIAPLLRQIPRDNVEYNKPVNCVYWGTCVKSGHRAIVCCCDGKEYPADYVIVTLPMGVMWNYAYKMFCPELPSIKIDALRHLGLGHCNKVFVEFMQPFWTWQKTNLQFEFCNSLCGRIGWTRGIKSIEIVPHSKRVLCVWVAGDAAIELEGLADSDVANDVTSLLRDLTGCYVPFPSSVLRSRWSSNLYTLGAYGYDSDNKGALEAMAQPVPGPHEPVPPILLFAGEATVPGLCATISGAYVSGIREAERITFLTVQMRGPPLPRVDQLAL